MRVAVGVVLVAVAIAASGCEPATEGASATAPPTVAAQRPTPASSTATRSVPDWKGGDCTLPDAPEGPIGHAAQALVTAFGTPVTDTRFTLGLGLTPPRMTLLNRLPLKGNERTVVREMMWVSGACTLTVWLVQRRDDWRAVQTLRASVEAEY